MILLLAKDLRPAIDNLPLRSVKALNTMFKSIKNNQFDQRSARIISFQGRKANEIRVSDLDVIYLKKENKVFIVGIKEARSPIKF